MKTVTRNWVAGIGICLLAGVLTAQSTGTGSGSSSTSSSTGSSTQSDATSSQQGSSTAASSDTSSNASSSSSFDRPSFHASDYLAPLGKARWGPFSAQGIDAFGSWSNQPIGLNGLAAPAGLPSGVSYPTNTIGFHAQTNMGARWRWGTGFIGFQYSPSVDYQTATDIRQVNHNISLFVDHPFHFGKWRMTVGLHTASANSLQRFYEPPPLTPLVSFEVPISNRDLLNLLTDPQPLQPITNNLLLLSNRFFTGAASMAISRRFTGRDTFSINVSAVMNRTLNFGNETGALFNYPQSSGGSATAVWSHMISGRQQWSVSLAHSQAIGNSVGGFAGQQQSLQFTYRWLPWRNWMFSLGAGPSRLVEPGNGALFRNIVNVQIGYTFHGSALTWSYVTGFDNNGFLGGQQSRNFSFNWAAPQLKGHKWHYTITTSYQASQSLGQFTQAGSLQGVGGVGGVGTPGQFGTGAGVGVNGSFIYPISRALSFSVNYGYFFQVVEGAQNGSSPLAHYQRNIASAGFHYTFGGAMARPY